MSKIKIRLLFGVGIIRAIELDVEYTYSADSDYISLEIDSIKTTEDILTILAHYTYNTLVEEIQQKILKIEDKKNWEDLKIDFNQET